MNTEQENFVTTLYVWNLHPRITKEMLFKKFSQTGPVLSIRLCRDMFSRPSLTYAHINFEQPADAQRALDTMNFHIMIGRPICIMWSHQKTSVRTSGVGSNIFVKNLVKSFDNKDLYYTFSTFGTIDSFKIALDQYGDSKGYGFVHFETKEDAEKAIEKANGVILNDKKLVVGPFIPLKERAKERRDKRFGNVYISNLPESINEDKLKEIFEGYGVITSYQVVCDEGGKSRGFGFVTFEDPVAAENAVTEKNGMKIDSKTLYVGIAQSKAERQMEIERKFEPLRMENRTWSSGVIHVKNLDDTIDDEKLREEFQRYGTISSANVMMSEDGRSRGFGFVCFSSPEEASQAAYQMNGRIVSTKPLYVDLTRRYKDCKVQLTTEYIQRIVNKSDIRMQQIGQVYNPGSGHFTPTLPQPPIVYTPPPMAQIRPSHRWDPPGWVSPGGAPNGWASPEWAPTLWASPEWAPTLWASTEWAPTLWASHEWAPTLWVSPQVRPAAQGPPSGFNTIQPPFRSVVLGTAPAAVSVTGCGMPGQQNMVDPLFASALASAHPQYRKQMLGERLFPFILHKYPTVARKVTGMFLELENTEILSLLEDSELLSSRVEEAITVLEMYQSKLSALQTQN